MDLGKTFPVSNFLSQWLRCVVLNDTREPDIQDRCGLPLNGGKLGGV